MARKKSSKKGNKSGCKFGYDKNEKPYLSAWNVRKKRGLISILVFQHGDSKEYHAPKSRTDYRTMIAKVTFRDSGEEKIFPVSLNLQTKKVVIEQLGMVLNPNKNYCGTFSRRN